LTEFSISPMLAPHSEEDFMRVRTKLVIALTLTAADIAVFIGCVSTIWHAWGQVPLAEATLAALLTIWAMSLGALWLQVSTDLRRILCRLNRALQPARELIIADSGRDSDV
jgi:hypothetical protein